MSLPPGAPSRVRGHGRTASSDERRRVAIPRPSTKSPLEHEIDDPLSEPSSKPPSAPPPKNPQSPTSPRAGASMPSSFPPKDFSYILSPANYHPVPTNDIPSAFLNSIHQPPLNTPLSTLLAQGHFRPAAVLCARALTTSISPTDHAQIFSLLYTRLACLTLINQHGLAAQESKCLGDLSSSFYRHPLTNDHIVPWELRVLAVRLMALGYSDWRKGIMGYYELARDARLEIAKHSRPSKSNEKPVMSPRPDPVSLDPEHKKMWEDRLHDLGIRVASLLAEMGDFAGAARHLKTLQHGIDSSSHPSQRLAEMEALVHLRIGDIRAARTCISALPPVSECLSRGVLEAMLLIADGDYKAAASAWQSLLSQIEEQKEAGTTDHSSAVIHANFVSHNLSLTLLYTVALPAARDTLEQLLEQGPPYKSLLFNLSTVYELCTEKSRDKKKAAAERLASTKPGVWGQGQDVVSWEWGGSGEFKL